MLSNKITRALRSTKAAIDLASVMVGVIVIGIIAGIIAATIFGIVPWAQDKAARASLDGCTAAQSAYFLKANEVNVYGSTDDLVGGKYLPASDKLSAVVYGDGSGYRCESLSDTTRVFVAEKQGEQRTAANDNTTWGPTDGDGKLTETDTSGEVVVAKSISCITEALGKPAGYLATSSEIATIFTLNCNGLGLTDQDLADGGFRYLTARYVYMNDNEITDSNSEVFAFAFTNATTLELRNNNISNLDYFTDMSGLYELDISGNELTNLDFMRGNGIERLHAANNRITDVSGLVWESEPGVPTTSNKLRYLDLSNNKISDLSQAAVYGTAFRGVDWLDLRNNDIAGVNVIAGASEITYLFLSGNRITDLGLLGKSYIELNILSQQTGDLDRTTVEAHFPAGTPIN